jgi:hypothetical protein
VRPVSAGGICGSADFVWCGPCEPQVGRLDAVQQVVESVDTDPARASLGGEGLEVVGHLFGHIIK